MGTADADKVLASALLHDLYDALDQIWLLLEDVMGPGDADHVIGKLVIT